MKLEKFSFSEKKAGKWFLYGFIVAVLLMVLVNFVTSKAKYRTTQSIPLVRGKISYKMPDLNVVAMYQQNDSGEYESVNTVPSSGYTLNTNESYCEVNKVKDESITMEYANGLVNFNGISKKGTKCYLYFDKIKDTTVPTISNVTSSADKTSITVTVTASDDTGLASYCYSINDGAYESKTTNSHTFSELTAGTSYTIKVYVMDVSGNQSEVTTKTISTESDGKTMSSILAGYTQSTRNSFSAVITDATTKQVYSVEDDLGTSLYFAGAPTDNWVSFGGFYWRIIRMNGDGSTRLIYAGSSPTTTGTDDQLSSTIAYNSSDNGNAYVGYMYGARGASSYVNEHANTNNSTIKGALDTWYSNLSGVTEYIDGNAGFCNDRSVYSGNGYGTSGTNYAAYNRLNTNKAPSLKCTNKSSDLFTTSESSQGNGKLTYPIGLITADEVAYAGGVYGTVNQSYYLYTGQYYRTMSPSNFSGSVARAFYVDSYGRLDGNRVSAAYGVRPVINLKSTVGYTGTGSSTDPFTPISS